MNREIAHARRAIDKQTLLDLLTIAEAQVKATRKAAEIFGGSFCYPMVEEIFCIVLDALNVPDNAKARAGVEEIFYSELTIDDSFSSIEEFYQELIIWLDDQKNLHDGCEINIPEQLR